MTDRTDVFDLARFVDQRVRVRFQGGREVDGVLKGWDKLDNLVLDECVEYLRDPQDAMKVTSHSRTLGLVVCRGTQVCIVSPSEGREEIANPFLDEGDETADSS